MAYQKVPDSRLVRPAFNPSPLRKVQVVSQGTLSKPVPIKYNVTANGPKNPAPSPVNAPGAIGTI